MKVKEWFVEREQSRAARYNIYFEIRSRDPETNATMADEAGYLEINAKKIGESEKAINVEIANGGYTNTNKDWKCWIPKSLVGEEM